MGSALYRGGFFHALYSLTHKISLASRSSTAHKFVKLCIKIDIVFTVKRQRTVKYTLQL